MIFEYPKGHYSPEPAVLITPEKSGVLVSQSSQVVSNEGIQVL